MRILCLAFSCLHVSDCRRGPGCLFARFFWRCGLEVTIYFDDPGKQTKIWSIERQLDKHVMMVLYLDVDVTIRPDSLQWGLIPFLVPQSHSHRPGESWLHLRDMILACWRFVKELCQDVFVRDSWPVIECILDLTYCTKIRSSDSSERSPQ